MIDDHAAVCRSIGYFWDYIKIMAPIVALAWATWRIAR